MICFSVQAFCCWTRHRPIGRVAVLSVILLVRCFGDAFCFRCCVLFVDREFVDRELGELGMPPPCSGCPPPWRGEREPMALGVE